MTSSVETIHQQKSDLRSVMAERRADLHARSEDAGKRLAHMISSELAHHPQSDRVAGYWPYRSEIDPRPLLAALRLSGSQICLPITGKPATPLNFHLFASEDELVSGRFGIKQPLPDSHILIPTLMFIPLLAIDHKGFRLGYGGGYYDRTLAELTSGGHSVVTLGLGYDEQLIGSVPTGPYDVRLDGFASPSGITWFGQQ